MAFCLQYSPRALRAHPPHKCGGRAGRRIAAPTMLYDTLCVKLAFEKGRFDPVDHIAQTVGIFILRSLAVLRNSVSSAECYRL